MLNYCRRWQVRPLALLVGALAAFFLQFVAMTGLGLQWAGSYDVMHGGCGWDGTCSDAGTLEVTIYGWLTLIAIEAVVGIVLAQRAGRRHVLTGPRRAGSPQLLWANCLEIVIIIGCLMSWAIGAQNGVIGDLADHRYPGVTGWQPAARFSFTWSVWILAAEIVVGLLAVLAVIYWRRSRSGTGQVSLPRSGDGI